MHRDVSGTFDHYLYIPRPSSPGELSQGVELGELGARDGDEGRLQTKAREAVNLHERRTGFRPNMLHVGYRIEQDDSSLFSYTYAGRVLTIDPVSTASPEYMTQILSQVSSIRPRLWEMNR